MKNIYLFVGRSGSGKSTIADKLAEEGLVVVESYTDRPPRYEGERGHVFLTTEQFNALPKLVAYTKFDEHQYGVTQDVVEESDIYIIDIPGVETMKKLYTGKKGIVVIGFDISLMASFQRMLARGDSEEAAGRRIDHDNAAFRKLPVHANYLVNAEKPVDEVVSEVKAIIKKCENTGIQYHTDGDYLVIYDNGIKMTKEEQLEHLTSIGLGKNSRVYGLEKKNFEEIKALGSDMNNPHVVNLEMENDCIDHYYGAAGLSDYLLLADYIAKTFGDKDGLHVFDIGCSQAFQEECFEVMHVPYTGIEAAPIDANFKAHNMMVAHYPCEIPEKPFPVGISRLCVGYLIADDDAYKKISEDFPIFILDGPEEARHALQQYYPYHTWVEHWMVLSKTPL